MSQEKGTENLKYLGRGQPTVEIKEHPPELLELDEETVAIAKAKFSGVDLDGIYGDEDRSSPELIVRVQSKKIRDLFETVDDILWPLVRLIPEVLFSSDRRCCSTESVDGDGVQAQRSQPHHGVPQQDSCGRGYLSRRAFRREGNARL